MGDPATVLAEEEAARQTTRLILIEGGKSAAGAEAAGAAGEAAGVEILGGSMALETALAPLAFLLVLLWPSSIAPEPPVSHSPGPMPIPHPPPDGAVQTCPKAEPRHATQTCSNEELTKLQAEKDALVAAMPPKHTMDTGNPKKAARIPCSYIRQRLEHMKRLKQKRVEIQDKCFDGKPDAAHKQAIDQIDNSIKWYEELKNTNCAPGHPMEKA